MILVADLLSAPRLRAEQEPATRSILAAVRRDFGSPWVSSRAAALGDTILGGQSRWYFVFDRDPTVLGGCPSGSTFNATQTGRVSWQL